MKSATRHKRYKEVVKHRIETKPPVIYTKHLKSRKHKKLKVIGLQSKNVDNVPVGDDEFIPASFKEMMFLKENKFKPKFDKDVGDTEGMKRKIQKSPFPKQGKYESDGHYIGRVQKEVEDELYAVNYAKQQHTRLVSEDEVRKSKKKRKAVERLNIKRKVRRLVALNKGLTGFEHLQDKVNFNEVVDEPPKFLTKPKLVFGKKQPHVHKLDKLIAT